MRKSKLAKHAKLVESDGAPRPTHHYRLRGAAVAAISALALAACGTSEQTTAGDLPESLGGEPCDFTIGILADIDPAKVPDHAAFAAMREDGCNIKIEELAETELVAEGVVQNRYQLAFSGTLPFFILAQKEQPVVALMESYGNDLVIMGKKGIETCEDIHESGSLAIPSMGAATTAIGEYWFKQNCPDLDPPFVAVPGGPERAQALLSGQIDNTIGQLSDAVLIKRTAGDDIDYVANFSDEMPELVTFLVYANSDWVNENPNTVKLFLSHRLEINRKIVEDPEYFKQLMSDHEADIDAEDIDELTRLHATANIYDPNGGLAEADMATTLQTFIDGETMDAEPAVAIEQFVARDLLNEVLDEIGRL